MLIFSVIFVTTENNDLFFQTHKWVNAESMLEKCFIGPLKRDSLVRTKPSRTGANWNFFFNPLVKSHTQMTQQIEKFANVFKKKWMKKYLIFIYIFFFELVSKGSGKALNVSSSSLKSSNSLFVPGAQGTDSSLFLKIIAFFCFILTYLDHSSQT